MVNQKRSQKSWIFCFLFLLIVGAVFGSGNSLNGDLNIYPNEPSHTEAYQKASKYFEASIDTSVNSCDDFYQYSCGNFNSSLSFVATNEKVYQEMINAYNKPNENDPLPVKQVKKMYQQCLKDIQDWDQTIGNGTLLESIVETFMLETGLTFPLFFEPNSSSSGWPTHSLMSSAMGYLKGEHGIDTLLSMKIRTNSENPMGSLPYILNFDIPSLTMDYDGYQGDYWDEKGKSKFTDSIRKLFVGFRKISSIEVNDSEIEKAVEEIVRFEEFIANNFTPDSDDDSLHLIKFDQLKRKYSTFDFTKYITSATINADEKVFKKVTKPFYKYNIRFPKAFQKLNDTFGQNFFGDFSSNIFGNYLYYRLLKSYDMFYPSYLSISSENEFLKNQKETKNLNFQSVHKGSVQESDSSELQCFQMTSFPYYANLRIYVDKHLPKHSDRARYFSSLKSIIDNVVIGMQSMIDGLSWMRQDSKEFAYSKLQNLAQNYVYPEWIMDDKNLTEYYSELPSDFMNLNFPQMSLKVLRFLRRQDFDKLLRKDGIDRNEWPRSSLINVKAWRTRWLNSITIPLPILQEPFFNLDWPTSVNFGGIGFLIGHEIAHGFDTEGIFYGPFGEVIELLDSYTSKFYDEMIECVIEEYSDFCPLNSSYIPNCVNGEQTQKENFADNVGIHAAFRAYRNIIEFNGFDPVLPRDLISQLSHDQLFFLSFAQIFCKVSPPPNLTQIRLAMDPFPPLKYRVQGTIQNFPAFRNAFNCPIGSNSAPKDHCNVFVSDVNITKRF